MRPSREVRRSCGIPRAEEYKLLLASAQRRWCNNLGREQGDPEQKRQDNHGHYRFPLVRGRALERRSTDSTLEAWT